MKIISSCHFSGFLKTFKTLSNLYHLTLLYFSAIKIIKACCLLKSSFKTYVEFQLISFTPWELKVFFALRQPWIEIKKPLSQGPNILENRLSIPRYQELTRCWSSCPL